MGGPGSGRPPSSKTIVNRMLGKGNVQPLPAGDDFIIPNHSGISEHPEFLEALAAALAPYLPLAGGTMTGDLNMSSSSVNLQGSSANITHDTDLDIFPNDQATIGLRIKEDGTNLELQALGTSNIEFLDDISMPANIDINFGSDSSIREVAAFPNILRMTVPSGGLDIQDSSNDLLFIDPSGVTIGGGAAGTDYTLTFDGETNDGVITWKEDEDEFEFSDDIQLTGDKEIRFRDNGAYIFSGSTGRIEINGGNAIRFLINGSIEIALEANTLTFNNGTTDMSFDFSSNGQLFVKRASTTVGTFNDKGFTADPDCFAEVFRATGDVGEGTSGQVIFMNKVDSKFKTPAALGNIPSGASSGNQAGWLKLWIGTTASWIPYWQ